MTCASAVQEKPVGRMTDVGVKLPSNNTEKGKAPGRCGAGSSSLWLSSSARHPGRTGRDKPYG